MDLVTFLILTYNSEHWIEKCLHSVRNQTYLNLQILIIDDGSEDNTVQKIKQISDRRIELFCKEHSGISKSLNFALNKIKSNYIARIDSDDVCVEERITKQMRFLTQNPEYGILGTNFILIDEIGNEKIKVRNPEKDFWIKDIMLRRCSVWMGSVLMRKEILDIAKGFDEERFSAEDWDFFLRVINKTKFYNIQEYLNSKRIHRNNITAKDTAYKESEKVLLNYNKKLINSDIPNKLKAKSYFNIGYYYYYESDFNKALNNFSESLKFSKSNLPLLRYYFSSKYLKDLILFMRKYKVHRLFDWLRILDKKGIYFKGKY